jgi:hypothetical protein
VPPGQRVELVRAVYAQAAGGDLVERFRDEAFIADLTGAVGYLAAPAFEFVLVKGMAGPTGVFPGVPVEQKGAVVWTFDGEAVVRIETYLDRRLALKALSLPG